MKLLRNVYVKELIADRKYSTIIERFLILFLLITYFYFTYHCIFDFSAALFINQFFYLFVYFFVFSFFICHFHFCVYFFLSIILHFLFFIFPAIIRAGSEDKIQQVLITTVTLMETILAATRRAKLPRY